MAAVSSPWTKSWALESEELDAAAEAAADKGYASSDSQPPAAAADADFPALSAAAATKVPKKKKKQTLSLAELHSNPTAAASFGKFQPSAKTLTPDESFLLPTGPRERSEEELKQSRFGYFNGGSRSGGPSRGSDETRAPSREPKDLGPSRADQVDDWGRDKKPIGGFERRERERDRGFFDSQSKADESDSWISGKGTAAPPPPPRERRGFDFSREGANGGGADSDTWGRKREDNRVDSDSWGRKREDSRMDSDSWGKKREENGADSGGRPRLVLQPRTLPIASNRVNGEEKKEPKEPAKEPEVVKTKGANPFGNARPREEVLKEKGKDWKEIDEKLEATKIQESAAPAGRMGFGMGSREDRTERAWRRPEVIDATPMKAEEGEETPLPSVEPAEENLPEN